MIYLSEIFSVLKDIGDFFVNLFDSLVALIEFLWELILQLDDMVLMVSQSAANLPVIFTFIPPTIVVFASVVITVAVLYLILGRNK